MHVLMRMLLVILALAHTHLRSFSQAVATITSCIHPCAIAQAVATIMSAVFMLFVGLSMPPLFAPTAAAHRRLGAPSAEHGASADDAGHGSHEVPGAEDQLGAGGLFLHVVAVSIFMV